MDGRRHGTGNLGGKLIIAAKPALRDPQMIVTTAPPRDDFHMGQD